MEKDECSALKYLDYEIRDILKYKIDHGTVISQGSPGSIWTIINNSSEQMVRISVFNNETNIGYQFELSDKKTLAFCNYIKIINQHMLENGERV